MVRFFPLPFSSDTGRFFAGSLAGFALLAPALPVKAGDTPAVPGAPAPAAAKGTPWAADDVCGQVLALSVDDAGSVYAAVTARAFGRGTVLTGKDPALQAEDRDLRSVADRVRLTQAWLGSDRLKPLLNDRQIFFSDPGDGPANFLTKFSESVRRLDETDHQGHAGPAVTVADGFHDPADGAGGALLALPNGVSLYGCPPRLWRLEAKDGTERQAHRSSLAEGFGLRNGDSEAGLHALLEGPDGWIYFGMGDRGYRVRTGDGKTVLGQGSGAIFRCRADGSGLELFASGLHNPTGLAMDADGRLFAMDQAAPGGRTRLLLVIPGADFGWQAEEVTEPGQGRWFSEGMETLSATPGPEQPLWCLPPLASLDLEASSLEMLAGAAGHPELLAADRRTEGKGGLVKLSLEAAGTVFRLTGSADVWRGGAVMATAMDPGGSLVFADWGTTTGAFSHCQLRRLTPPGPADPGNIPVLIKAMAGLPVRELRGLLENASPRLRLRAGQRLASLPFQESMESLLMMARRSKNVPARVQALWSAGALARNDEALTNELVRFLDDAEPAVRAAAAAMLGEGRLHDLPPALRSALTDPVLPVRLAAAAAMGRLRLPGTDADLLAAAAQNESGDPFLRSSLAAALAATTPAPALAEAGKASASKETRLTVVHALRRLNAAELSGFLADPDPLVATEAARAVYDLPVFPALPALAALLDGTRPPSLPSALSFRAIQAGLRGGLAANAAHLADFALAAETKPALQLAALNALAAWDTPPQDDPLRHRAFQPMPRLPGQARDSLRRAAKGLADSADATVSALAKSLLNSPAAAEISLPALTALLQNADATADARLSALRTLIARNALPADAAHALSNNTSAPPALRAEARSALMRRDPKTAALLAGEGFTSGSVPEKQAVIRTLDHLPGTANDNERLLLDAARRLSQGSIEPAIQVEVLEALQRRDIESRSPWRRATDAWLASIPLDSDPLALWRMTMTDGDPAAGRLVYETQPEIHCTDCHSIQGQGGIRGPELDGVADRLTAGGILESLVHPGAHFAKGWESSAVPDPSDPSKTTSPMPPLGTILTRRELRDLIAYLSTLKAG